MSKEKRFGTSQWVSSFSVKHKRPLCLRQHSAVSLSILLTSLLPNGFLNIGQGFSFILSCRWKSLNYLSLSSAVSGAAVDLVKTTWARLLVQADSHSGSSCHKAVCMDTNPGSLAGLQQETSSEPGRRDEQTQLLICAGQTKISKEANSLTGSCNCFCLG